MDLPAFLLTHELVVEPYLGSTAHGPAYGPPVIVAAFVEAKRTRTTDRQGRTAYATTVAYTRLDPGVAITVDARVTVDGRPAEVLEVARHDGRGLPTPDHLELVLR